MTPAESCWRHMAVTTDPTTKCLAAANLRGEHIPCDEKAPHEGWAHGNAEHGLIWASPAELDRMAREVSQ